MDYQNAEFYKLNENNPDLVYNFADELITYRKEIDENGNLQIVEYRKKDGRKGKKTTRRVVPSYEMTIEDFDAWKNNFSFARCTEGVCVAELYGRVCAEMLSIAAENDGKTVLIATHATPMRLLTCEWCCAPIEKAQQIGWVKNASVSIVDYDTVNHKTFVQLYDEASFMGDISTALPKGV